MRKVCPPHCRSPAHGATPGTAHSSLCAVAPLRCMRSCCVVGQRGPPTDAAPTNNGIATPVDGRSVGCPLPTARVRFCSGHPGARSTGSPRPLQGCWELFGACVCLPVSRKGFSHHCHCLPVSADPPKERWRSPQGIFACPLVYACLCSAPKPNAAAPRPTPTTQR